jgi:large subunit ribosomal protein L13
MLTDIQPMVYILSSLRPVAAENARIRGGVMRKTTAVVDTKSIPRAWYLVDATDMVLGRLASRVALLLTGKAKPVYSPNQDHGDYVIVVNSEKVRLTGKKAETKEYFRHSGYSGGEKVRSFRVQMQVDPTAVILHAVRGLVPKTALGRRIMRKLHVYAGSEHPHAAQRPQHVELSAT